LAKIKKKRALALGASGFGKNGHSRCFYMDLVLFLPKIMIIGRVVSLLFQLF